MTFINRYLFNRQAIEILPSALKIHKKTLFNSVEYEVSFEKLDNKLKVETTVRNGLLFIAFFFTILGFLFLTGSDSDLIEVFFLVAAASFLIAIFAKLRTITLASYDRNNIVLYFTKSNKEDVIEFANQIIQSGNSYLLAKYGKVDKALPIENQLNNLHFLRNKEIITEDHFENLKN